MNSKHWLLSRTLWLNALAVFAAMLMYAAQNIPALAAVLPNHLYVWLSFALPLANAGMRVITTQALHFIASPAEPPK